MKSKNFQGILRALRPAPDLGLSKKKMKGVKPNEKMTLTASETSQYQSNITNFRRIAFSQFIIDKDDGNCR